MQSAIYRHGSYAAQRHPYARSGVGTKVNSFFHIFIAEQPEGVWLATSADIPGLFVEGDTLEEARAEASQWARELLADNLGIDPDKDVAFVFDDGRERVYTRA